MYGKLKFAAICTNAVGSDRIGDKTSTFYFDPPTPAQLKKKQKKEEAVKKAKGKKGQSSKHRAGKGGKTIIQEEREPSFSNNSDEDDSDEDGRRVCYLLRCSWPFLLVVGRLLYSKSTWLNLKTANANIVHYTNEYTVIL